MLSSHATAHHVRLDPILTHKLGYLRGSLFTDTTRVGPKPVFTAS